jgi:hypothetical protein
MKMKKSAILAYISIAGSLVACGSNFEWFPATADTTPPTVTASISGNSIFANRTTHVSSLPASVTFFTNEAATVFYTIDGTDPTSTSSSVGVSSGGSVGPSITTTKTVVKFLGRDQASNNSAIQASTIVSP